MKLNKNQTTVLITGLVALLAVIWSIIYLRQGYKNIRAVDIKPLKLATGQ